MPMYKANPVSRDDIRRYVRDIRRKLGYENTLCFPIVEMLEIVLPKLFPNFNYEILPKSEMGNKHGETNPSQEWIHIRADVYEGACNGNGRDRLTIAHEIGHFLLHSPSNVSLCQIEPQEKLKAYEDPEWQANAFGGELLAPSYLIKGMCAEEVHEKALVSLSAAETQLRHLPKDDQHHTLKGGGAYDGW